MNNYIDTIVFTQEELENAILTGYTCIGLCDNSFVIPKHAHHISFVKIGEARIENLQQKIQKHLELSSFKPVSYRTSFKPTGSARAVSSYKTASSYRTSFRFSTNYNKSFKRSFKNSFFHQFEYEFELGKSYRTSYKTSYQTSNKSSSQSYKGSFGKTHHTGPWAAFLDELFCDDLYGYGMELI